MQTWDIFFTMELFFGAVLIGLVVSLILSYFFSFFSLKTTYELEKEWAKKKNRRDDFEKFEYLNQRIAVLFWGYALVILLLIAVLLYSFVTFADITNKVKNTENFNDNTAVTCFNNTTVINNYNNFTINEISIKNDHKELSIKELQYLVSPHN